VYKTRITDLDEPKQRNWKRNVPSWITSSLQQLFVSGIVEVQIS